jgi:hypothetical protein
MLSNQQSIIPLPLNTNPILVYSYSSSTIIPLDSIQTLFAFCSHNLLVSHSIHISLWSLYSHSTSTSHTLQTLFTPDLSNSTSELTNICTIKPAHVVTSIKQSPVLKGHPFLVLWLKISSRGGVRVDQDGIRVEWEWNNWLLVAQHPGSNISCIMRTKTRLFCFFL